MPAEAHAVVDEERLGEEVRLRRRCVHRVPLDQRIGVENREDLRSPDDRSGPSDDEPAAAEIVLFQAHLLETLVTASQVVLAERWRREQVGALQGPAVVVVKIRGLAAELRRSVPETAGVVDGCPLDPLLRVRSCLLDLEAPARVLSFEKNRSRKDAAAVHGEERARQRSRHQGLGFEDVPVEGVVGLLEVVLDVRGDQARPGHRCGGELDLEAPLVAPVDVGNGRGIDGASLWLRLRRERLARVRETAGCESPEAVPPEREAEGRFVGLVHELGAVVRPEGLVVGVVSNPLVARQGRAE